MVHEQKLSAVMSDFARTLGTDFPIQRILDLLVTRIVEVLPVTAAGVTLISPELEPRYVAASDEAALHYEQLQTDLGEGPCLAAYLSGEAVTVAELSSDERFPVFGPAASADGLAAVFTFPLRHGNHSADGLGALDLYRDTVGGLDPRDLEAAQTLADVVAAYLLNAQQREDAQHVTEGLRADSLHDPLTGLPNRALLQERLQHAMLRAKRSHGDVAVLFTDLDRFKAVNDTHGHAVGDELLMAVAVRLTALLRPGDTLARVSGDEFVILCEDLNQPADAEHLVERIATSFATPFVLDEPTHDPVEVSITASVGLAFASKAEDISDQLVRDADLAMYEAKRSGGGTHHIVNHT